MTADSMADRLPSLPPQPDISGAPAAVAPATRLPASLYLIELFLFFEYVRIQDIVPGLSALRLPLILTLGLALVVLPRLQSAFTDRQTRNFGLLIVLMGVHVPLASNNYWAFVLFFAMLFTFIAYLAMTQVVITRAHLRHLVSVWLVVHALLAVYAVTHQGRGPAGFPADENDMALIMNMVGPIPFFLLLTPRPPVRKPILVGLLALYVMAAFSTLSRGGFVGLLAVALYCLWKAPRKGLSIAVLSAALVVASFAAPAHYWDEMGTIWGEATGEIEGTGGNRQYIWRVGTRMFLWNPILGVGPGNFPFRFAEYEGEDRWYTRSLAGRAAHSIYFTLLPELGLIGAGIFLAMLRGIGRDVRTVRAVTSGPDGRPDPEHADLLAMAYACKAALIGYLVTGIFISSFYYPPFWYLIAFSAALRRVAQHETTANTAAPH